MFYPPAFDFGLNMLYRLRQFRDVFFILVTIGKYSKALDFGMSIPIDCWTKYSSLREMIEQDNSLSDRNRSMLVKRINMIKQNDDICVHKDRLYRPFFEDAIANPGVRA